MSRYAELHTAAIQEQEKVDELWKQHLHMAQEIQKELTQYLECPTDMIENTPVERDRKDIFITPNAFMFVSNNTDGFWHMPLIFSWGPHPLEFTIGVKRVLQSSSFDAFISSDESNRKPNITNVSADDKTKMQPMIEEFYNTLKVIYTEAVKNFQESKDITSLKHLRDYSQQG